MNPIFYLAGIVFAMLTWYCVNETKRCKKRFTKSQQHPEQGLKVIHVPTLQNGDMMFWNSKLETYEVRQPTEEEREKMQLVQDYLDRHNDKPFFLNND